MGSQLFLGGGNLDMPVYRILAGYIFVFQVPTAGVVLYICLPGPYRWGSHFFYHSWDPAGQAVVGKNRSTSPAPMPVFLDLLVCVFFLNAIHVSPL